MVAVNAHNSWDRLEEVWLGDVYPAAWYDHLESEVRDVFAEITEKTKQDLDFIQEKIESFGVTVRRPVYHSIEDRMWHRPNADPCLFKPEITPRDQFAVIGQTLYTPPLASPFTRAWQQHIDLYGANQVREAEHLGICGANTVRAGRDLYFDTFYTQKMPRADQPEQRQSFIDAYRQEFPDYRLHFLDNGGHVDACFALLKPGVILCNAYFSDYERTFPTWHLIKRSSPEYHSDRVKYRPAQSPNGNLKWWLDGKTLPKSFNEHVIAHALDWVGDYTETYFEVNCLSIDPENVLVLGEHETLFRELERLGITAHPVPFRCRTFWDGGMHCLTVDIRRRSTLQDYFPERPAEFLTIY